MLLKVIKPFPSNKNLKVGDILHGSKVGNCVYYYKDQKCAFIIDSVNDLSKYSDNVVSVNKYKIETEYILSEHDKQALLLFKKKSTLLLRNIPTKYISNYYNLHTQNLCFVSKYKVKITNQGLKLLNKYHAFSK